MGGRLNGLKMTNKIEDYDELTELLRSKNFKGMALYVFNRLREPIHYSKLSNRFKSVVGVVADHVFIEKKIARYSFVKYI